MRQPNLLRLEFSQPAGQTVVFDGEFGYAYVAGSDQVTRYAGPDTSFLVNLPQTLDDLSNDYDVTLAAETGGRTYELHLDAKTETAPFRQIRMWIDRKQLVAVRADFYDAGGNNTSYRLSGYSFNLGLPASRFSFEVPPGAEVVDVGGPYRP